MSISNPVRVMEVYYRKEIQAFEYVSFTELKLEAQSKFCCKKFMKYCSSVNAWSGKIGKFCILEKDILTPIDYCPFCGEKIQYITVE